MEPDNPDNTEPLGLEPEVNPLMAEQSERTDLADDEKLAQFFGRALADGQQEAEPQSADTENTEAQGFSDEPETSEEPEAEEPQETEAEETQERRPTGVDKRISKLTAQRKEAEERAKQLEDELEALKRSQAAPRINPKNPYSGLISKEKIEAEYEKQKEIRLFCERYPDGYYAEGKEPIDKEQIAKAKVAAIRAIEDFLPKQLDYVEKTEAFHASAIKEFPWLKDKTDQRTVLVNRFVDSVPEIKRFPDYEIYAAHLASGMTTYQQQKRAAKSGTVAQHVPVQPGMTVAPAPQSKKPDAVKAKLAEERYRKSSSLDDLSDVFRNKFI